MCKDGYGYVGNACESCENTDENLLSCTGNVDEISACMPGYNVSDDNLTCVGCIENCSLCMTDATLCDDGMCMDGYTQNEGRTSCLACATGCKSCSSTCIKGCHECWAANTTTEGDCECPENYEYDEENHTCNAIPVVDPMDDDGEMESDVESSSGSVLKFAVMIFVLCLSYMIWWYSVI